MRAAFFKSHGGPDRIRVGDVPDPVLAPGEALVRVRACALNRLDLWTLANTPGLSVSLPHIGGADVFGVVESAPNGALAKAGDEVVLSPGLSCGSCPACKAGRDNLCGEFRILGLQIGGGLAEKISIPAQNLVPAGASLSPEEWAALPVTFMTAWHMLSTRAGIKPGSWVFVQGAGSGVGCAAIEVAKFVGAKVLAAARTESKRARAIAAGAEAAFDPADPALPARVRAATGGAGADIVVEHIGGTVFEKSLECLAPGGRLVTCGATIGAEARVDLLSLFWRERSVLGSMLGTHRELLDMVSLARSGVLKPVVDRVFPLSEARAAYARLASGEAYGKVVVRIS
ncbi:MAG: zinc-binding dehydrogenase [Planctomycetota bacterium]